MLAKFNVLNLDYSIVAGRVILAYFGMGELHICSNFRGEPTT